MSLSHPSAMPPKGGIIKRIFAWMIYHNRDNGDDMRKRTLLSSLQGSILEIGPGTGANLNYLPTNINWIGVEPNPYMIPYLKQNISKLGQTGSRFEIHPGYPDGYHLPADEGIIDAVISTHVLCSVPHPEDSLKEILRVLRPGGRFIFIEHVAAPMGSRRRWFQDKIQPVWTVLGDGCHPNRETWNVIQQTGFVQVDIEHFRLEGGGPVQPHISGTAVKES
jgi:SAM-dependent methyltransferase